MAEPLVSIHMITYNQAPYIGQAIEGVLRQKVDFGVELVIGEDCSTDGTREIVLDIKRSIRTPFESLPQITMWGQERIPIAS